MGRSAVSLSFSDIMTTTAEVIVSSDDFMLSMGGGVSGAIARAAGTTIAVDAAKFVPCELGEVVVTSAGALSARYVFHAITIGPQGDAPRNGVADDEAGLVRQITRRCLALADGLGVRSVAFPAVGAGVAGLDPGAVALAMADVIDAHLSNGSAIEIVELHLQPKRWQLDTDYIGFFEAFAARAGGRALAAVPVTPTTGRGVEANVRRTRDRILAVARDRVELERSIDHSRTNSSASQRMADQYVASTRELAKAIDDRLPARLFISYAHDDQALVGQFLKHLAGLQLSGVAIWSDHAIAPGAKWHTEIGIELEKADVALFLLSSSFLASEFCVGREWARARERSAAGEMSLVPVVLKACDWQGLVGDLQAVPAEGRPLVGSGDFDERCVEVVTALRSLLTQP